MNWHYKKGYHQWVKEILGLASYNNYGVSGYKVSDVLKKVNSVNDTADIIFVMAGVNDVQFDVPLGTLAGLESGTVYGNLNLLCSKLREKYPVKLLVFITPHEQTNYPSGIGVSMYDVAKAVKEVCEKHSIVVYDNFVNSEICTTNLSYWTTDNCHWNDSAHEMVGKNLSRFVVNTFRYIYSDTSGGESAKTLNSITATFAQGDTIIYDTDTLDSLKQYLTVTANYSDGSTETVTGYTLSGTLAEGTSTVTASYGGKSATFTVNVTKNNESGGGDTDVEDDRYIGKTFKMTGENEGVFNATAIVEVDSDCAAGKTAALTLIGHDADNLESGSIDAMAVFGDNTGVCGNSEYTGVASSLTSINTYVTDGVVTVNASYTLTTVTSKYLKIPAPLKYVSTANPASVVIDQISVTVDGKEKEIIEFGGFFSHEKCTFELLDAGDDSGTEDDATGFVGKTFRTKGYYGGEYNFTTLVGVDSDFVKGNTVEVNLSGSDAVNIVSGSGYSGMWGDETGACSNSAINGQYAVGGQKTVTVDEEGNVAANISHAIVNDVTTPYLKVNFILTPNSTAESISFTIDQISVTVNGNEKEILDIGGFYEEETCELV